MELSSVNRLIAFAQELGVREVREVARTERPRPARVDPTRGRSTDHSSDPGLKVSLSATANRLAEGLTVPTDAVSGNVNQSSDETRTESTKGGRGRAIAAYQRTASATPGERIRVRA